MYMWVQIGQIHVIIAHAGCNKGGRGELCNKGRSIAAVLGREKMGAMQHGLGRA